MSVIPAIDITTIDIFFRPSEFVRSRINTYAESLREQARVFAKLVGVFVFNLVLYSIPITLSGIETVQSVPSPPQPLLGVIEPIFNAPLAVWEFSYRAVVNAGFLSAASATAFIMFHLGVVFLRRSQGLLQSLHTIIYTSSIYLAGAFTIAWYASTADAILVADTLLVNFQKRFIYFFIDLTNRDFALPGGRPEPVPTDQMTMVGELVVFSLLLLGLYFIYSLYLGAKINHDMSRSDAIFTTLFVLLSPVIYIIGSIIYTTTII